ncbi:MAG: nitroreductase family protein [Candidatus Omnitrophota bacterium]
MNEIMANIKSRRSRRAFVDKPIPEEIIEDMLEAARYAPSALNKQPARFIVVSNKEMILRLSGIIRSITEKIARLLPLLSIIQLELRDPRVVAAIQKTLSGDGDTVFYGAPLLILIAAEKKAGRYAVKDCSLAAENMMLYANSVGIGSCFIGRADMLAMSRHGRELLGLPPQYKIHAALVFGYTPVACDAAAPQRMRDNVLKWVR